MGQIVSKVFGLFGTHDRVVLVDSAEADRLPSPQRKELIVKLQTQLQILQTAEHKSGLQVRDGMPLKHLKYALPLHFCSHIRDR